MKVIRKYHFFPLILFLSLFVDGQISFLISRFCPNSFEPTSFLFLYGFMLLSLYFLRTIGIAFLVFPLLQVIFYRCNQIILVNRLTRFFTFLLMILIFQISTNLLLIIFIGIKFNWITLIIHQIAPSLILNVLLLIVLQPLLEKIYL